MLQMPSFKASKQFWQWLGCKSSGFLVQFLQPVTDNEPEGRSDHHEEHSCSYLLSSDHEIANCHTQNCILCHHMSAMCVSPLVIQLFFRVACNLETWNFFLAARWQPTWYNEDLDSISLSPQEFWNYWLMQHGMFWSPFVVLHQICIPIVLFALCPRGFISFYPMLQR